MKEKGALRVFSVGAPVDRSPTPLPPFVEQGSLNGFDSVSFRLGKVKLQISLVGLCGGIITNNCLHETEVVKRVD